MIGELETFQAPHKENLSVITLNLGAELPNGHIRELEIIRHINYSLGDIAAAFIGNASIEAPKQLEDNLSGIFS